MKKNELIEYNSFDNPSVSEDIFQSLKAIELQLKKEVTAKQVTIEKLVQEMQHLRTDLHEKDIALNEAIKKFTECQKNDEGNRQLINKLLGSVDRLQQDIEWYKRTYENRSVLGTLKQKIFKRR